MLFPGTARSNALVAERGDGQAAAGSGAIAASLGMVGPRLRGVRERRGLTLTRAAEQTGISKSTLSRLENGQRRPTLELLLLLADAYRVPIDDLVGAPPVGDPRIRLKPRRVHGRTVLPLTGPGGVQARKIVIRTALVLPAPVRVRPRS